MSNIEGIKREKKIRPKLKSERMFATGSSASGDTILTSSFNEASRSFANNKYLDNQYLTWTEGAIVYALHRMQEDVEDLHMEVSQSVYVEQISTLSLISTGSVGVISSSLIPNSDNVYDLGSSTKEWKDLYVDGTANIDTGNITAGHITRIDGPMGETLITFDKGDTAPKVSKGNMFKTSNINTTNIKSFTGGVAGQEITIILMDGYTDFTHGGARNTGDLTLQGGINWTVGTAGDTITLVSDGTYWYEKCRSDNTR